MIISRRIAAIFALLVPFLSYGRSPKLAQDLDVNDAQAEIDVIVQFAAPPGPEQQDKVNHRGGKFKADLHLINAAAYTIPASALADLADDPDVVYISPDREVGAMLDFAEPTIGTPTALKYGLDGTGVGIAIIDSGILTVRDLQVNATSSSASRVTYSESFVPKVSSATDQYGHGTHVAGILAGNGTLSTGPSYLKTFRGVAPNANLINLRALDGSGAGTDSTVIAAIDRAIQLKSKYYIRVINLSLGRPVFESYKTDPLCQAVERAWKAGIVVVVAAGNDGRNQSQGTDGYATINSPANDPLVIAVGAMKHVNTDSRADDRIASYSSKGPSLLDHVVKPDILAPGNRIISLVASKSLVSANSTVNKILFSYYQKTSSKSSSSDYYRLSGTSMATPMVSGAAAVMIQKDWSLTPDTIKARLMKSASKTFPMYGSAQDPATGTSYQSQYDIFTVGAGYLDVWAALNAVDVVPSGSTAASPVARVDPGTGSVLVDNCDTSLWGTTAIWGTDAWGATAVWGTSVFLDGAAAVWGSSALWGGAAVWGTSASEANSRVWGSAAIWGGVRARTASESMSQLINGEN
jgi:serine protease AprX